MKVAMLTNSVSTSAGGLYHSVRELAKGLLGTKNITIELLAIEDEQTSQCINEWREIRPVLFKAIGPAVFNYSPGLSKYLKKIKYDLYHVNGIWQYIGVAVFLYATKYGKPYMVSPRGMLDEWALNNSRLKKEIAKILYERRNLLNASCIHALTFQEYKAIRAYNLKNPTCILPNGVELKDMDKENTMNRYLRNILGGRRMLLFLSRLHPKKGLVNLIHAWRKIKNEGLLAKDWVLGIAGWDQGGHEKELMILADSLGIKWFKTSDWESEEVLIESSSKGNGDKTEGDVIFFGPAFGAKKDALFRYCSGFILPSYSEGMPVAVLEAWSYGKPVIMTKECNLDVGFVEGAAIRVDPTADSVALGIRNLVEMGDAEVKDMGNKGRRLVEKQFTWPEIAKQMKSVYDWMLGGGTPPSCVVVD